MKKLLALIAIAIITAGCGTLKQKPDEVPEFSFFKEGVVSPEYIMLEKSTGIEFSLTKTDWQRAKKQPYAALKVYAKRLKSEQE